MPQWTSRSPDSSGAGPLVAEVSGTAVDVLGLQTGYVAVATIKATAIRLARRGEGNGVLEGELPR